MSELIVIFRTQSDVEASVVRGLLEAHGISSIASSDVPHSVFPLSIDGLGEVRIAVLASQAEEAVRLIEDHRADVGRGRLIGFPPQLDRLEERMGYRFRDRGLLERALTHRSHAHEAGEARVDDYESLEFLGDAVLGLVVADLLFRMFPHFDEGQQSKLKGWLVSTSAIARIAERLSLGDYLRLGRGEEKTGGRRKRALLADSYEALVAAVFLDGGFDAARDLIRAQIAPDVEQIRERGPAGVMVDYKSALQEWLQSHERPLPVYRVSGEEGPDHCKVFHVEVVVDGQVVAGAEGRSKKGAQQEAAREALERLTGSVPGAGK